MRQSIKVNKVSITLNKCRYLKLLSFPSSLALFVAGTIKYEILINKKEQKKVFEAKDDHQLMIRQLQ